MSTLTRRSITRILGPVDDSLAAEIVRTGASEAELQEARAWLASDEALLNEYRPLPKGGVGEIIELLQSLEIPTEPRD